MSLGQRRVKKTVKINPSKSVEIQSSQERWLEQNRQVLGLEFDLIASLLAQKFDNIKSVTNTSKDIQDKIKECIDEMDLPPAYEMVGCVLGLSDFEKSLLLLVAAAEIDPNVQNLLCEAGQQKVTFALAFRLFEDAYWNAIGPQAPLRYWRILTLDKNDFISQAALRLDERIIHALLGIVAPDERLMPYIRTCRSEVELSLSQSKNLKEIPVDTAHVNLHGANQKDKPALVKSLAQSRYERAYILDLKFLPQSITDRHILAILWQREVLMAQTCLYIDAHDITGQDIWHDLKAFLGHVNGRVYIGTHEPLPDFISAFRLAVSKPLREEQKDLWVSALSNKSTDVVNDLPALIDRFDFGAADIDEISDIYKTTFGVPLHTICKKQSRPSLDSLAQRIETRAEWGDLILPESKKRILMDIERHVMQRSTVFNEWGFDKSTARGLGISTLLTGPSGTGKTLAAEILAKALKLDLYKVDLSSAVSKYIGETEKNLRRIFDVAENGGVLLLFDEADALFGKRTEAQDSNDRHSNMEVSYLLQRMEQYQGLVILTTNFKSAIDKAFMRRINYCIQFSFPDFEQRKAVWANVFPDGAKTKDLDFEKLAALNIAPGHIRNMALYASFIAADEGVPVQMKHLLYAAQAEYMKLEKTLSPREVQGWV